VRSRTPREDALCARGKLCGERAASRGPGARGQRTERVGVLFKRELALRILHVVPEAIHARHEQALVEIPFLVHRVTVALLHAPETQRRAGRVLLDERGLARLCCAAKASGS